MLASPATRKVAVFDAAFTAQGLTPIWTPDEAGMLSLIRQVKAGAGAELTGPLLAEQAELSLEKGADHLLIACTELSLLTGYLPAGTAWTDSLDCLTGAIVDFATAA